MAQEDLAAELEVGRNTLGAMELGLRDFGVSKLISVCEAFGVTADEVLPERLARERDPELRELAEQLAEMKPYARSQCLKAVSAVVEAFANAAK